MPAPNAKFSVEPLIPLESVRRRIEDALHPRHFYVATDLHLLWQPEAEQEIAWEIFHGRLLDARQTRQTRTFRSWNIYQADGETRSPEPLLSVKLDEEDHAIHVVRAILCYVWEGYDAGGNVILSRETTRWVRELVGTINLKRCSLHAEGADLEELLTDLLTKAVRGTSRLPLTSVETPLPDFTLGRLAYYSRGPVETPGPLRSWQELVDADLHEDPAWLETLLRAVPPQDVPSAAALCSRHTPYAVGSSRDPIAPVEAAHDDETARGACLLQWRRMFNNVSLSPYTPFVDNCLAFLEALVEHATLSVSEQIDFFGWLLRRLGRHLTAYDLITFHHRGANYPDALVLDDVLKKYLELLERHPNLFHEDAAAPKRRRALRQGCLLRRYYENHLVPDAPTSPGENARVLPLPHVRVPEEQLHNVLRRKKRLYAGEPLPSLLGARAREALRQSILDLAEPDEWRELGTALFIDRPFGWGKAIGEPDQTPLVAQLAFSPSIAGRRLHELLRLADELGLSLTPEEKSRAAQQESTHVPGLPLTAVAEADRPVASLADARRVADDFVVIRTLAGGASPANVFDFASLTQRYALTFLEDRQLPLIVRALADSGANVLGIFDAAYRRRLELREDLTRGFAVKQGLELPARGFKVLRLWEESGEGMREHDLRDEDVRV